MYKEDKQYYITPFTGNRLVDISRVIVLLLYYKLYKYDWSYKDKSKNITFQVREVNRIVEEEGFTHDDILKAVWLCNGIKSIFSLRYNNYQIIKRYLEWTLYRKYLPQWTRPIKQRKQRIQKYQKRSQNKNNLLWD